MFSFFGSKNTLAPYYPPPAQGRIVEPFAGSARYSLRYRDRQVWLNDADPVICDIWRYLISSTRKDILALPELKPGEDLRAYKQLSQVERNLLGFQCAMGRTAPGNTISRFYDPHTQSRVRSLKERILRYQEQIRHWKVTCGGYHLLPNVRATWFIDPPYVRTCRRYPYGLADYDELGEWCRAKRGRVIVCEGAGANWLPFRHFAYIRTQGRDYANERLWWQDR
jgi:site-specific DNA-adenine methylase